MAFTTRSQRQTSFIPSNALETPGPGQFNSNASDFDRRAHFALAPFSSTTRRDGSKKPEEAPGPGQYFRGQAPPGQRKDPSSVFQSRTGRFDANKRSNHSAPAPGDYHKPTEWVKKIRRKSTGKRNEGSVVWVKVSSAPSIPDRQQSHGYEEGPSGELIRQKAPVRGFKGTKDDMVGPTDYTYKPSIESSWDKNKGRGVFRSKTKRGQVFDVKHNNPAPGQYHADDQNKEENPFAEPPQQSSSFASKTQRSAWNSSKKNDESIGPGSYIDPYKHATSFKKKKIAERYQNFGSSSIRGYQDGPTASKEYVPGPGHFVKDTNMVGKGPSFPSGGHGAFGSTSDRFRAKKADIETGPGQYESQSFLNDVQKKQRIGSYGVFGSTSRRFNAQKSNAPGVGVYNPKHVDDLSKLTKRNDPRSSVFASRTRRDAMNKKMQGPSPGEYHRSETWVKKGGTRMQGEFGTRDKRFKNGEGLVPRSAIENPNAAPGRYEDFGAFCRTKNKKNFSTKMTNFSTSSRFQDGGKKRQQRWYDGMDPAPGSYEVNDEWNKKTYNVSITEG